MSTNGASEPSMEEILASIRNIIAQDPADSDQDFNEATAKTGPERASGLSPFGSAITELAPEPEVSKPTQPLGERLLQVTKQPEPAKPEETQSASATGAEKGADSLTKATAASAAPSAIDATKVTGKAVPADDFSDVFEEPLKPSPVAAPVSPKAGSTAQPAKDQAVSQTPAEPLSSPTVRAAEPTAETGREFAKVPEAKPEPQVAEGPDSTTAAPAAGGFDFAKLRARAPLTAADELQRFSSDIEPETEPLPLARSDAPSKNESDEAKPADANAEPAQPRVIAAMPQQSAPVDKPSSSWESVAAAAKAAADQPVATTAAVEPDKVEPGFKSANVGFLAASPRPLEAKSKAQSSGDEFFKAVAGEAVGDEAPKKAEPKVDLPDQAAEGEEAKRAAEVPAPEAVVTTRDETVQQTELVETAVTSVSAAKDPLKGADSLTAAGILVSSEGGGVRTLEDTVADLLRPLLREWLENNMPRIVENALRLEVAESVKKQLEKTVRGPNGLS